MADGARDYGRCSLVGKIGRNGYTVSYSAFFNTAKDVAQGKAEQ